jgi:hypothetical protein
MAENNTPKIPFNAQYHGVLTEFEEETNCIPNGKKQPRESPKGKVNKMDMTILFANELTIAAEITEGIKKLKIVISKAIANGYTIDLLIF